MPRPPTKTNTTRNPEESPAAWFAVLEAARTHNNFALAAQARRELERLGVKVTYQRLPHQKMGVSND